MSSYNSACPFCDGCLSPSIQDSTVSTTSLGWLAIGWIYPVVGTAHGPFSCTLDLDFTYLSFVSFRRWCCIVVRLLGSKSDGGLEHVLRELDF